MSKRKIIELRFPVAGINRGTSLEMQPSYSSPSMKNVRAYDTGQKRIRGGQRPGLKKAFQTCIGNGKPIVAIAQVTVVEVS